MEISTESSTILIIVGAEISAVNNIRKKEDTMILNIVDF